MPCKYTFFLFVVYYANGVLSNNVLSQCKVTDETCINKSVQAAIPIIMKGFPDKGVESSDPLFIEKIEGDLSILKYKFFNSTVVGYKDCEVAKLKVSPDLSGVRYELNCPQIKMNGQYEISGRLVILPVEGNGDYQLVTGKYNIAVDSELKQSKGSDGKTYLTIKNFKLKCTPLSPIRYDFKNLFNGQKDLSDAVHKFAHESWHEVAELVQDPTWYACMKKVISNVNKYLKTIPLDEYKLN